MPQICAWWRGPRGRAGDERDGALESDGSEVYAVERLGGDVLCPACYAAERFAEQVAT